MLLSVGKVLIPIFKVAVCVLLQMWLVLEIYLQNHHFGIPQGSGVDPKELYLRECQRLEFLFENTVLVNVYNSNYCINPVVYNFLLIALKSYKAQTPKAGKWKRCQIFELNKTLRVPPNACTQCRLTCCKRNTFSKIMKGLAGFYQSKCMVGVHSSTICKTSKFLWGLPLQWCLFTLFWNLACAPV